MRNKEFSKFQENQKKKYLKQFGEYYLITQKNDIRVFSPKKVEHMGRPIPNDIIRRKDLESQLEEKERVNANLLKKKSPNNTKSYIFGVIMGLIVGIVIGVMFL